MNRNKMGDWLRILAVGDIIGRPGRRILARAIPVLKHYYQIDGVVVNVENAAGGFGMTPEIYSEFLDMGIDVMTSGNHIFDKRGYEDWMDDADRLLRPENFPPGTVGTGLCIREIGGVPVAVLNLMGRTFMKPYDCPFRAADTLIEKCHSQARVILVDFHAEATSEKMALGWHLCGRVSAVWGTHTHVPTADTRIIGDWTAYQTDLGMTGPYDSVIGMIKEPVIHGFRTLARSRFEVAKNDPRVGGCLIDIDPETGRSVQAKGLFLSARELDQIEAGS